LETKGAISRIGKHRMIDEEKPLDIDQSSSPQVSDPSGESIGADATTGVTLGEFLATDDGLAAIEALDDADTLDAPPDGSVESADYQAALLAMEQEMKNLKAQVEERTSQCVRIAADFDNYRKRTQREREELEVQLKCSTINELLPVVDNFERARSQIKPQTDQETTIHKSYQSVYKQLVECLKRIGVAPMRSEGKEFDPNLHEAVMREATDEYPEGTVMEELVRGYVLGDRVLRHALVKVAAAPEPVVTSEESTQGEASN